MPKIKIKGNCYCCKTLYGKLERTKLTCVDCRQPVCDMHSWTAEEIGMWGTLADITRCLGCEAKRKQEGRI